MAGKSRETSHPSTVIPDGKLRDDRPELDDPFINVIHQFADTPQSVDLLKALGAILGLKDNEIADIFKSYTCQSTECCKAVLKKWLQSDDHPTWGKLDDAINLLRPPLAVSETYELDEEYKEKTISANTDRLQHVHEVHKYNILLVVENYMQFKIAICHMEEAEITKVVINSRPYFLGTWGQVPVILVQMMESKGENESENFTKKALLSMPHIKYVFAIGVCGTFVDNKGGEIVPRVKLCEVVISSHVINQDESEDLTQSELFRFLKRQETSEIDAKFGKIFSTSSPVADSDAVQKLLSKDPEGIAIEMDGFGIAIACKNSNPKVECLVVKGASDFFKRDTLFPVGAGRNAVRYLSRMLNKMLAVDKMETIQVPTEILLPDKQSIMDIVLSIQPQLEQCIVVDELLQYLNTHQVLTKPEREHLGPQSTKTPTEKIRYLLSILESKSPQGQSGFVKALFDSSFHVDGHQHLIGILQDLGVQIHKKSTLQPQNNAIDPKWFGTIETASFNENGGKFHSERHGVIIMIPFGAIPKGVEAVLEFAAKLIHPAMFKSSDMLSSYAPVSATIRLKMDVVLQKPISVRIPHYAIVKTKTHTKALSFAKMTHNQFSGNVQVIEGGIFPIGESYGEIKLDHFCYICIISNINIDIIPKNYSFVIMKHQKPDGDHWKCDICWIPSLPTLQKVLEKQYEDMIGFIRDEEVSNLSIERLHAIKLLLNKLQFNMRADIDILSSHTQIILQSEVDLKTYVNKEIELHHKMINKSYPPRFRLEVTEKDKSFFSRRQHLTFTISHSDERQAILKRTVAIPAKELVNPSKSSCSCVLDNILIIIGILAVIAPLIFWPKAKNNYDQ